MLKAYYHLAKPGIVYGNVMTTIAGFLFASQWRISPLLFVATISGTALVIGSACAYNNYLDRSIDRAMSRTKKRELVTGAISGRDALIFATVLGAIGFAVLCLWTNWWVVGVGAIGFVDYVVLYGMSKRRSHVGTLIGSISGSMPLVAGYVAVSNHVDGAAILLFLAMTCWQMPHFYAIALRRLSDYKAAHIPVLPAVHGARSTKWQMLFYTLGFGICTLLLPLFSKAGYTYEAVMVIASLWWIWVGLKGLRTKDDEAWARSSFFLSLKILMAFSIWLALAPILP